MIRGLNDKAVRTVTGGNIKTMGTDLEEVFETIRGVLNGEDGEESKYKDKTKDLYEEMDAETKILAQTMAQNQELL